MECPDLRVAARSRMTRQADSTAEGDSVEGATKTGRDE